LWNGNLHDALRPHYKTYRGTGNVETLLAYCRELAPCVLLLDSDTVWKHAEEHQHGFSGACSDDINILVVDNRAADPGAITELLRFGCKGVLNSQASPAVIRKAAAAVSEGEIWAPRQVISTMLHKCLFQLGPNALTQREKDILELIARGLTNMEIAQTLFIARETVRWHIRSLYSKIGASDRLAAAVYAKEVLFLPNESSRSNTDDPIREGLSATPPQTLSSRAR
jgi:DNA-binding NarL/FixJ family response regulator